MLVSKGLASLVACIAFATAAAAGPELYECDFPQEAIDGNWLPSEVAIFYDKVSGLVRVIDPMIQSLYGDPVQGRMAEETDARITFVWDIQAPDVRNHLLKMHYSLSYFRNGNPPQISAHAHGYDNTLGVKGTCKVSPAS